MTPQEQEMIDGLISRIRSTQAVNKDAAAEQHIQQGLAGYPDALYVLTQTVLVQQYGLEQAKVQLDALKQQNEALQQQAQAAGKSSGSFLSHIFGSGSSPSSNVQPQQASGYQPVSNPGYQQQQQPYPAAGGYPPPPPAYPQAYPSSGYGGGFGGGGGGFGGGGFLQGAMQTAAGVAAGEMMFQGMESLFHGFEHGGSERGFSGGGGETIVNNYGDTDDRGQDRGQDRFEDRGDSGRESDQGFYNANDDASRSDTAGNSSQFADTDNGGDLGAGDDNSFDSSSDAGFDNSNDFGGDDSNS